MMGDAPLVSDLGQPLKDGLSARALLSSIRRHPAVVLAFTLLLCAAGALVGLGLPDWFQADGVLVIHAVPQRMAELQGVQEPLPDLYVIQSEVDTLQSRSVIEPVVRSLRLWGALEFQKMEYPGGWNWQTVEARLGERWRDIWKIPSGPEDKSREQPLVSMRPSDANLPTQAQVDAAVGMYAGYLAVSTDGRSMTIHVSYRARTPERAAAIVNAHIDNYRDLEVKAKVAAAEHANSALRSQIAQLRQQLQAAEAAVSRYREDHLLTGAAKDSGTVSQQLATLNSQLIIARADLAENEARAARIVGGAGSDSLPEVVASGTISILRGQEAQLVAREADLSKYHGDEYPELQRVRASLRNLRDQISRQVGRDRAAALQMVERSRTRERSLQKSLTELTQQLNSADAGLQQLQGNAESIRTLLVNFEKRVAETAANPAFITSKSIVASRASPATTTTARKAKILALAGGFVGLTLGSLVSLLLELRENGFRTSTQVQAHIGAVTVSATPRALSRQRKFPADIILNDNRSVFAEAFRVSWANIQLGLEGPKLAASVGRGPAKALGITSAVSGEGKSVHALAFARTAALAGEKVVLVDADLRRSGVSRLLHQDFRFTLSDFLQDRCAVDDIIAIEERSGVHYVPGGPADVAWTNQDLHRFSNFVKYLKNRFDIVIIDLPPILGLAETIRLAMVVDSIGLIIRWGRTDRQLALFALDALRSAGVSLIAVILNDIDLKAQRRSGYLDRSLVYAQRGLYRAEPGHRVPATTMSSPMAAVHPDARSDIGTTEWEFRDRDQPRPGRSDIEKLYDRKII